jgi:hypothetical protein
MSKERKHPSAHKQSVEQLRAELQKGIASLDRGDGQELDMSQVISTAHADRAGLYRLSDAERAAVRKGIDAAKMGHFAPVDEMEEFYRLHRGE